MGSDRPRDHECVRCKPKHERKRQSGRRMGNRIPGNGGLSTALVLSGPSSHSLYDEALGAITPEALRTS